MISNNIKDAYWTRKNIHNMAIPHMITRVLVRFNEWYRYEVEDKRVITDDMIKPFMTIRSCHRK